MNNDRKYHREPEEIFLPLPEADYAKYYALEMESFTADIPFYRTHCPQDGKILELGCGEGRISRDLASRGHSVTGVDISLTMLRQAMRTKTKVSFVCMDMMQLSFTSSFDTILIPYNTMNLLRGINCINRCLAQCRPLLRSGGSLLLQVYCPELDVFEGGNKKIFQFNMLPLQKEKGKIIKETLRSYYPAIHEIHLEERYRIRPAPGWGEKQDYKHTLYLAVLSVDEWRTLLQQNSFTNVSLYSDYSFTPYNKKGGTTLLIKASA